MNSYLRSRMVWVSAPLLALFRHRRGVALADTTEHAAQIHRTMRHFLVNADGTLVPVGPQICGNPAMQQAFNQFHYNIHHSQYPSPTGPVIVETLGPQDGAPGLHNGQGAEIIGVGGCG